MTEKLSPGRAQIKKDFQSVSIEIPAKRNWFAIIFIIFWSVGWLFGEVSVLTILLNDDSPLGAKSFFIVWLIFWTIGGLTALSTILWQLFGKEIIRIERNILHLEKSVFGIGRQKEYNIKDIKNLAINPVGDMNVWGRKNYFSFFGNKNGKLKFDYGMKTIKFANDIDEAEARKLLDLFKSNPHFRRENFLQTNDHF